MSEPPTIVESEKSPEQLSWETGFTDPRDFLKNLPAEWRFLVHGLSETYNDMLIVGGMADDVMYTQLQKVEQLKDLSRISCSVIDQDHPDVWGGIGGIILSVPFQNVRSMSPEDIGSGFASTDTLSNEEEGNTMTLDELMKDTMVYNEVVLKGTSEAGSVKMVGIIIYTEQDGSEINSGSSLDVYDELYYIARKYKLTVIRMVRPDKVIQGLQTQPDPETGGEVTKFRVNNRIYSISSDPDHKITGIKVQQINSRSKEVLGSESFERMIKDISDLKLLEGGDRQLLDRIAVYQEEVDRIRELMIDIDREKDYVRIELSGEDLIVEIKRVEVEYQAEPMIVAVTINKSLTKRPLNNDYWRTKILPHLGRLSPEDREYVTSLVELGFDSTKPRFTSIERNEDGQIVGASFLVTDNMYGGITHLSCNIKGDKFNVPYELDGYEAPHHLTHPGFRDGIEDLLSTLDDDSERRQLENFIVQALDHTVANRYEKADDDSAYEDAEDEEEDELWFDDDWD